MMVRKCFTFSLVSVNDLLEMFIYVCYFRMLLLTQGALPVTINIVISVLRKICAFHKGFSHLVNGSLYLEKSPLCGFWCASTRKLPKGYA